MPPCVARLYFHTTARLPYIQLRVSSGIVLRCGSFREYTTVLDRSTV